jgi:hypothetical protein
MNPEEARGRLGLSEMRHRRCSPLRRVCREIHGRRYTRVFRRSPDAPRRRRAVGTGWPGIDRGGERAQIDRSAASQRRQGDRANHRRGPNRDWCGSEAGRCGRGAEACCAPAGIIRANEIVFADGTRRPFDRPSSRAGGRVAVAFPRCSIANSGQSPMGLPSGEAGIGKSRLTTVCWRVLPAICTSACGTSAHRNI